VTSYRVATFARRRRKAVVAATDPLGAGNTALVTALGGDAAVLAFYDVRKNVTLNGSTVSQWDDVRGATGFGPSLAQATAANQPTWDSAALTMTFNTTSADLHTPATALFDLSSGLSIAYVGTLPAVNNSYAASVADSAAANRVLSVAVALEPNVATKTFPGPVILTSGVAAGSTRRLMLAAAISTTSQSEVPAHARATSTITAVSAGNNALCLNEYFAGAGAPRAGIIVRAVLVLAGSYTTAQKNALATWASNPLYHNVVLAS